MWARKMRPAVFPPKNGSRTMTFVPNLLASFRFLREVFVEAMEARRESLRQHPNLHFGE
jgi:hypothetical protein